MLMHVFSIQLIILRFYVSSQIGEMKIIVFSNLLKINSFMDACLVEINIDIK